ncbi:MAG: cytochrome c [Flavobacteriales bacterium]|jgi:mono/diheme cytochrome c family protein|nr:cytochrome c [Flavobacteriales bacterium]
MNYLNTYKLSLISCCLILLVSCVKHPDSPGYEYMPDMYRSQAIEAYVDYGLVADVEHEELKTTISARIPVDGTIPYTENKDMASINMPFNYGDGEQERIRAGIEVQIPQSYIKDSLTADFNKNEGKKLYEIMCTHCHGDKGEGNGKVVKASGDLIVPPSYVSLKDRTLGSIFHTITHGKNAMGPHGSQMNKDERWKVALYVRSLQNGGDLLLSELNAPESSNDEAQMNDN